ncbi:unnamed protein product [Penicillium bialowiezense]
MLSLILTVILGGVDLTWADISNTTLPATQQGWASISNTWSAVTCDWGQNYVTSTIDGVVFGRCCDNIFSSCGFGTRCDASTIYYHSTGYSTCKSGKTCNVMSVYDYTTTEAPVIDIFCWDDWPASQIFRYTTAEATTSTLQSQTTLKPAATLSTPFSKATVSTTASPTPTTSPSNASKNETSNSWIAGAVVGPVAGCALIGALGFWLIRRKRTQRHIDAHDGTYTSQPYASATKLADYTDSHRSPPNELPAYSLQTGPSELASHHYR